jgi:hypothetical protein
MVECPAKPSSSEALSFTVGRIPACPNVEQGEESGEVREDQQAEWTREGSLRPLMVMGQAGYRGSAGQRGKYKFTLVYWPETAPYGHTILSLSLTYTQTHIQTPALWPAV